MSEKEKTIHCPQCGTEIAANSRQCFHCKCWLVAATDEDKREAQESEEAEETRKREDMTGSPLSGKRLDGYCIEDVEVYWEGFWGKGMVKRFEKIEQKRNFGITFSFSGLFIPSIWLAFRKKYVLSVLVMFINYGIPFGLSTLLYLFVDPASTVASIGNTVVNLSSVGFGLFFAMWLPHYFWKATKKDLDAMGCKDRPSVDNVALRTEIRRLGAPSYIGAAFSAMALIIFTALIASPQVPADFDPSQLFM